jgi:hypothetical protein
MMPGRSTVRYLANSLSATHDVTPVLFPPPSHRPPLSVGELAKKRISEHGRKYYIPGARPLVKRVRGLQ